MSNTRRIFLIIISLSIGMALSALIFYKKKGGQPFTSQDLLWMGTNLFFSLLIVLGIGFYLLKKNKDEKKENDNGN
jgi:magnesium-transporting ATPase (P-type)